MSKTRRKEGLYREKSSFGYWMGPLSRLIICQKSAVVAGDGRGKGAPSLCTYWVATKAENVSNHKDIGFGWHDWVNGSYVGGQVVPPSWFREILKRLVDWLGAGLEFYLKTTAFFIAGAGTTIASDLSLEGQSEVVNMEQRSPPWFLVYGGELYQGHWTRSRFILKELPRPSWSKVALPELQERVLRGGKGEHALFGDLRVGHCQAQRDTFCETSECWQGEEILWLSVMPKLIFYAGLLSRSELL